MRVETRRAVGRHRGGLGCGVALATVAVVLLVVCAVSAALFLLSPAGNNASASFIHTQPGSLRWNSRERINLLLMETTGHTAAGARTEMMTVVSFDPASRSVALLSIPSMLWVTIPGFAQGPVSEAYADGGPQAALLTVEGLTHVAIPYYLVLDADTLQHLVDAIGGITLQVGGRSRRLDGTAATRYIAASSSDPQGDTARMAREQLLLRALGRGLAQPQAFLLLPTIINSLGGSIPTNMPYDQIPALVRALTAVPRERTRLAMLDAADAGVTRYTGVDRVLLPDPQHVQSLAHRLFPDPTMRGAPAVDVFNGGGVPGQAAVAAAWLRQTGVRVRTTASADSFNYAHTHVLVRRYASALATHLARTVAALLQAPLRIGSASGSRAPVAVILGHDFQDPSQQ